LVKSSQQAAGVPSVQQDKAATERACARDAPERKSENAITHLQQFSQLELLCTVYPRGHEDVAL
jgi:hypothetical protein